MCLEIWKAGEGKLEEQEETLSVCLKAAVSSVQLILKGFSSLTTRARPLVRHQRLFWPFREASSALSLCMGVCVRLSLWQSAFAANHRKLTFASIKWGKGSAPPAWCRENHKAQWSHRITSDFYSHRKLYKPSDPCVWLCVWVHVCMCVCVCSDTAWVIARVQVIGQEVVMLLSLIEG